MSATGGTAPYSGTGDFTGVHAGTYSYTVTDANSGTATTTGNITEPLALAPSSTNTRILCNVVTSTVSVSATGRSFPTRRSSDLTGVHAGTYSYTVTDANSCTATTTGNITE